MSAIDRAFIRAYEPESDALRHSRAEENPIPLRAPAAPGRGSVQQTAPPAFQRSAPTGPHFRLVADVTGGTHAATCERRPLSTFAAAATGPIEGRFRPALEVDGVRWSRVAEELLRTHRSSWAPLVQAVLDADDAGRSLIGVAGAARGVGCTTITGCLARLLAEYDKSVALVDGDLATAGLARSLGLAVDVGWDDVLAGRTPLAEAVIHSNDDRLAVLPLVGGGATTTHALDGIQASVTAGVLRYHYDVVLIDLGAVGDEPQAEAARRIAQRCRLDALVLVAPPGRAAACSARLASQQPKLASLCLGVIENEFLAAHAAAH